jgi:RNA polymerase sigma-70 factor, ECF subfamily
MNAQAIPFGNISAATTDGALVARAIGGREDCFEELVHRYQRPIAAYVYRMTGDYESSLDLTQDVFIKVYNSLARYRSEYKFSTWIYRIAHNVAIDFLRRNSVGRAQSFSIETGEGEEFERQLIASAPTPEQESEREERRTEIESVVMLLPPPYRELIVLRHVLDMNYDEIAEVTNLPLGTVKNRIFRAREAMREMFIERGITGI